MSGNGKAWNSSPTTINWNPGENTPLAWPLVSLPAFTTSSNALKSLDIPVEVSEAGAFGESAQVEALTVLLRALADPQDALSLIAVLRGPLEPEKKKTMIC